MVEIQIEFITILKKKYLEYKYVLWDPALSLMVHTALNTAFDTCGPQILHLWKEWVGLDGSQFLPWIQWESESAPGTGLGIGEFRRAEMSLGNSEGRRNGGRETELVWKTTGASPSLLCSPWEFMNMEVKVGNSNFFFSNYSGLIHSAWGILK